MKYFREISRIALRGDTTWGQGRGKSGQKKDKGATRWLGNLEGHCCLAPPGYHGEA